MAEYAQREDDGTKEAPGPYWHAQLEAAQKTFQKWEDRGNKVIKRYRDERDATESTRKRFNILWSNVQVLTPSLYGRAAKPEVSRRNMDRDIVGRVAATMLERVIEYEVEQFEDFDHAMRAAVEDRLLPGRGTVWMRYDPTIVADEQTEEKQISSEAEPEAGSERVDEAHSPVDYVYWLDFLHSPARTWDEVWWVARWVYMTKEEGTERFGDVFKNVPIESDESTKDWQNSQQRKASLDKKAKVAEIWDKRTGRVCWVAKGYPQALDEVDDPLGLEGFFPCPKPLLATTTTGSLIPVPDYCEYQDQAEELDSITNRIAMLVKAVKAVGVFNAEYKELARMLNEGYDNKLFPVTAWAALAEKGGLSGAVDMLDITVVLKALNELYLARDQTKTVIYETMGLSDILRGSSNASETLGAQQIKAQMGSLRLRVSQGDVARFASDIFKLKSQIVCKFYPPELMVKMSGIMETTDGQDQQLVMAAVQMLKDSTARDFRIQVESDSLAQIDEQAEKEAASEALQAIGGFLKEAMPMVAQAPETLPMAAEMLLFLVRRFRAGRSLEGAIEKAMKALEEKAKNPQGAKPDPEMAKIQAQAQGDQMRLQHEQQMAQAQMQQDQQRIQMEQQAKAQDAQLSTQVEQFKQNTMMQIEQQRIQFDKWKAELDAATKIMVAQISAKASLDQAAQSAQQAAAGEMEATAKQDQQGSNMVDMHGQTMEALRGVMETLARPKTIVRGPDGKVSAVQ